MSKKILFSSILGLFVLFLIGGFVFGDMNTTNTISTLSMRTADGSNSTLYKAGTTVYVNFTVASLGINNITKVNISFNNNNYTFAGFYSAANGWGGSTWYNGSSAAVNYISNITTSSTGGLAGWKCYNMTSGSNRMALVCENLTSISALHAYNANTSIVIPVIFNITSAGLETLLESINLNTSDSRGLQNNTLVHTNVWVDGRAPRITNLNITDGNYTILNVTGNLTAGARFSNTAPLTITATITDLSTESGSLRVYYYTNTSVILPVAANAGKGSSVATAVLKATGTANDAIYSWTIPAASLQSGNITSFIIEANDTVNHVTNLSALSGSGLNTAFNMSINSTVPKLLSWNATDGTNWVKNGNGYLKASSAYTVYVDASGLLSGTSAIKTDMTGSNVTIYYAVNGIGTATISNESVDKFSTTYLGHGLTRLNLTNLTTMTPYAKNTWKSVIPAITDSQRLSFLIVASEGPIQFNYTTIARGTTNLGFNITADSTAPTATLTTTDLDALVETSGSITYACSGADGGSGVSTYKFVLDKPGETSAVDSGYIGTGAYTFTSSDTNKAGIYTVHCYVKDAVGNEGSTTKTFNAQYSSGSGGSSSGGGGSSGGSTIPATVTPKFDADLTKTVSNTMTVTQGASKKFTLDGKIEHKLTVNKVTATMVSITLMSTPITLELTPGQVELVDLNADGVNDVKVTLKKINGSNADITIEKLAPTPVTPVTPPASSTDSDEVVGGATPESQGSNSSWVWWLVGIIVVAGLVYLIFFKKR